jgi:hypothetical protein
MRAELDSIDDRTVQVVLPKSDLKKALNYLQNHGPELMRYVDDAETPIDNNECEQLMKQVAVGRKPSRLPELNVAPNLNAASNLPSANPPRQQSQLPSSR